MLLLASFFFICLQKETFSPAIKCISTAKAWTQQLIVLSFSKRSSYCSSRLTTGCVGCITKVDKSASPDCTIVICSHSWSCESNATDTSSKTTCLQRTVFIVFSRWNYPHHPPATSVNNVLISTSCSCSDIWPTALDASCYTNDIEKEFYAWRGFARR